MAGPVDRIHDLLSPLIKQKTETDEGSVFSTSEIHNRLDDRLAAGPTRNREALSMYEDGDIDRRTFCKLLGLGVGGAFVASSGIGHALGIPVFDSNGDTITGHATQQEPGNNEINLGDQGLSNGDTIDGYLNDHFSSGNRVIIPEGSYQWNGGGLGGSRSNAALIGDGTVEFQIDQGQTQTPTIVADNQTVAVKNIAIRGQAGAGKHRVGMRAEDGATLIMENFHQPDGATGTGHPSPIGLYTKSSTTGHVQVRSCYIEGFYNNGIYAGNYRKSGTSGHITVDSCFVKNCGVDSVRLGGETDICQNTVIVHDGQGGYSGRGIRFRYPGQQIKVQNVHIKQLDGGSPIQTADDRMDPAAGQITDSYIQNDTGAPAINIQLGDFSASNLCLTGSGDLSLQGLETSSIKRGSECGQQPRDQPPWCYGDSS